MLLPPKNTVALSLHRSLSQEKVKELKCFVLLFKVEKTENRIETVILKKSTLADREHRLTIYT